MLQLGVMSSTVSLHAFLFQFFSTVSATVHAAFRFICIKFGKILARNSRFDVSFVTSPQELLRERDTNVMSKQSLWYKRSPCEFLEMSKEISEMKTCKYSNFSAMAILKLVYYE